MHYKVIHPDGHVLDEGLDEGDAKDLAVRVFENTGGRCTLCDLIDGKTELTWPPPPEKAESKKADTKKAETKKSESKASETAKAESKK
jgi:hypothetical protein